jgi:hypothetical protein
LKIFKNCYVALLSALESISKDTATTDPDACYRAAGMREAVKNFEFQFGERGECQPE